jgi:TolB-like protein/DNA-binding SARP family transcriptional activator/Tfp pilus assembly protein PilF
VSDLPRLRLTTLGCTGLEDGAGAAVANVPRRVLALLVRLVMARGGPVSRDHLCSLLWEDRAPDRGRHRLSDSLSVLRRVTGGALLETPADQLRLAADAVWCDAVALQQAVERECWEEAAAAWNGGFLEGFFFRGIGAFERWAEEERERLSRLSSRALEGWARQLEAAERSPDAVAAWARLAALQPLDSRAALALVGALGRSGNVAGALRQAEIHATLLRAELGIDPDTAFLEEVARIRACGRTALPDLRAAESPRLEPSASPPPVLPPEPEAAPARSRHGPEQQTARSPWLPAAALGASGLAVVALLGLTAAWPRIASNGLPAGTAAVVGGATGTVVAVLPFENLSSEPANAFFASGVYEEILTQLAGVPGLGVISRTSVLEYRGARGNLREIADGLGASLVLEGSVQRVDGRVRITVQLIEAARDVHLWAERYDRELDDIFAIQTDVARQVARVVRGAVAAAETGAGERPTRDLEAYDHYLRGLIHLRQGFDEESHRAAVASLGRAVELDPEFALAWSQLSLAFGRLHWFMHEPGRESARRALAAAERALALAPQLPEARRAMGDVLYRERRYAESLPYLEAAYAGRGGDAAMAAALAAAYRRVGRWEESSRLWERAMELDPLSGLWPLDLGATYLSLGRYREADVLLERAIALSPEQGFWPYWTRAHVHLAWRGDAVEARRILDAAPARFQRHLADLRLRIDASEGEARLEEGLARLRTLPADVADRSLFVGPRDLLEADYLRFLGREREARDRYEAARERLTATLHERPDDFGLHLRLGRAAAALGLRQQALAAAARAGALFPPEADAYWAGLVLMQQAYIRTALGDAAEAAELVERVLSAPSFYSRRSIATDPHLRPGPASLRQAARSPSLRSLYDPGGTCRPWHAAPSAPAVASSPFHLPRLGAERPTVAGMFAILQVDPSTSGARTMSRTVFITGCSSGF